jgi:hypothetical protein
MRKVLYLTSEKYGTPQFLTPSILVKLDLRDSSFGPGKDYGSVEELFAIVMEHFICRTRRCCPGCKKKIDHEEGERNNKWAGLPQDPREAPEDKAVLALRSLVRAAAEATEEATARVLARELAAATTSGAGLAKSQSKVFDPGGRM